MQVKMDGVGDLQIPSDIFRLSDLIAIGIRHISAINN